MTRRVSLVVLGVLLASLAAPGVATVALAQEEQTNTPTPTPAANESTVVERVDEDLYVEDYWYNASSETFFITLVNDGDRLSTVTITEAISRDDAGERKFGISVVDVEPDSTVTTSVSAKRVEGAAAVMVLTQKAIENGQGTYLQESKKTDMRLIKGGAEGSHVRAGGLFGVSGTIFLVVLGAWQYAASRNDDVVDADLDPDMTLFGRFKQ